MSPMDSLVTVLVLAAGLSLLVSRQLVYSILSLALVIVGTALMKAPLLFWLSLGLVLIFAPLSVLVHQQTETKNPRRMVLSKAMSLVVLAVLTGQVVRLLDIRWPKSAVAVGHEASFPKEYVFLLCLGFIFLLLFTFATFLTLRDDANHG